MNLPYINLPQSQAPQILGDIGDSLVAAAQRKQQEKQQAIDNLLKQKKMQAEEAQMRAQEARAQAEAARQQSYATREQHQYEHQLRQEAAGALPKMNEMIAAGDVNGAQALGQVHNINFKQVNGMEAPGAAPQLPQQGPAGPIPSPEQRIESQSQGSEPPPAGQLEQALTEDQQMAQQREQYAAALADHPRVTAEHAQRVASYKQAKENPVYRGDSPFGPVEFNPGAVRAQKAALQEQTAGQLAQGLPPQYQMRALALVKSGVPVAEAARQIEIQQKAEEERNFKEQLAGKFQTTADQKYQIGMANAAAHGLSARANVASKEDAASARAQSTLDRAMTHAEKTVDFKGLVGMDNTMRGLMANIDSPNVLQKRDAQIQLGRLFRGTTPTEGEMHLLYNNLGGTADRWNQFVAGLESGGLSDEQARQLKASAGTAHQELEHRKERAFGSLATQFGPGSGFEALAPQINTALKARGKALGVDVPDVYQAEPGAKGAQVLGSRLKGKEQPKQSNALVNAAKIKALAPQDREAVQWAQANPKDPRAAAILEKNGL